ncbi:pyrroline-5-carboxylate reductase [Candidatus Phycosocius spiralis]|uniref:Pyrroline-5-carboxylate reductase n=1 Tax=Candidatus Phycosocius spiralis TaxID=2815099 RepID=A0ABQ4PX18_9PROT|nr:pyrroline-5-carboxylate reductase [Candidatus Phycosocius spiralis]GIU67504.1 pyrroline-5-carboxylate reductase [Candidatus Phycosocius spiralis]
MKNRIALVGGGRMGGAMLRGWADLADTMDFVVFEPTPSAEIAKLIEQHAWTLNPDPKGLAPFDCVVLGIKPQHFTIVCDQIVHDLVDEQTIMVSIMAGIGTSKIAEMTHVQHVIRAMPNTPGQIGKGITAYWCVPNVPFRGQALAIKLLSPLGRVEKLQHEEQLDAVTAVSGSGPAYVFLLAEAMAAAGEAEGLERGLAERLAWQTVIGAGALLAQSGQSPQALRRAVTSPEGTTAAATEVLTEGGGIFTLVRRAIEAAVLRSRQIGK